MATIAYPGWPCAIVALHDRANPAGAVAGDLANLARGFLLRYQPDDLPVDALDWVVRLPVAFFDLIDAQMSLDGNAVVPIFRISQDLRSFANEDRSMSVVHFVCVPHRL